MKFHQFITLTFTCLCLIACNDNNGPGPIEFTGDYFEIRTKTTTDIEFIGGSGDYTFTVEDTMVLAKPRIVDPHRLMLIPMAKGETTLTITDLQLNTTNVLKIKVIDYYIAAQIVRNSNTDANPYLPQGHYLYFIADSHRNILISDGNGTITAHGRFDIRPENGKAVMDFSLLDRKHEIVEAYSYKLTGNTGLLLNLFNHFFDFGWTKPSAGRSDSQPLVFEMTDADTSIIFRLEPYHTFTYFPDIE